MPACTFVISGPTKLTNGQSGTFQLTPTPDGAVCSVQWTINGQPARGGNTYGDAFAVQVGFNEIIVRATRDDPAVEIGARVTCKGLFPCGPTDLAFTLGEPVDDSGIKAGNIVLIVLLPFIVVVGVALLPVFVVAWIIDKATDSDTTKQARKVSAELRKLLPRRRTAETRRDGS
jgi:hypothetical protein